MKIITTLAAFATLFASTALSQNLPTTGVIDSPLGKLEIINGFPSDETVKKLFDNMDFQRSTQAYIWALPYVAMGEWQRQQREVFGAGELDYVDYLDFKDKLGILTANATTPYTMAFPDLAKTGPLVFEIPPGPIAGGLLDFWQRPLSDTGQTGPDKGKGGKFLVLGPEHPDMKPDGYFVLRSQTNNVWSGQRGLDPDVEKAKALVAQLRIYPYAERESAGEPASRHRRQAVGSVAARRSRLLGGTGAACQRGTRYRTGPHHARHAGAARHRKRQAI